MSNELVILIEANSPDLTQDVLYSPNIALVTLSANGSVTKAVSYSNSYFGSPMYAAINGLIHANMRDKDRYFFAGSSIWISQTY